MVSTHASSVHFVKFVIGCAWYGAIYLLAVRIVLLQSPTKIVLDNFPRKSPFVPQLRNETCDPLMRVALSPVGKVPLPALTVPLGG